MKGKLLSAVCILIGTLTLLDSYYNWFGWSSAYNWFGWSSAWFRYKGVPISILVIAVGVWGLFKRESKK